MRLGALRVRLAAADAAAAGRADRHRRPELAGAAIAQPRELADDLVVGRIDVVGELDLGDRPQAVDAHADRRADDAALGDRRVEHAVLAVLALQAVGDAEHAAEVAHVLAEHHHVRVAPSMMSIAELSAWIMFICGMAQPPCSARSCSRCRRRCAGSSLNTSSNIRSRSRRGPSFSVPYCTASFQLGGDLLSSSFAQRGVPLLGPLAERDQVLLEALDRVAERPASRTRPSAGSATGRRWSSAPRRDR